MGKRESLLAVTLRSMRRHGMFPAPVPDQDRRPIRKQTVRRVIATFRLYRGKVALVGLAIVVTSGLGVVNPLLIKHIFDHALFGIRSGGCDGRSCPNFHTLYWDVSFMIAIPIVSGIIGIGQTYLANTVGLRVMQDFRNALYRHLQFMPLRFFKATRTGEIQSRLANDVVITSTVIAMLVVSWQLTALSLFMVPFFMWLTYKVGKARQKVATVTQQSLADLTSITEETLSVSGILLSKAL